ncbi:hypothetical protein JTB14_019120 [Gonioctena quinquepunctata]|nr:hypothetical protein JTB14_019120 [Gonioctena quinquepunctata]
MGAPDQVEELAVWFEQSGSQSRSGRSEGHSGSEKYYSSTERRRSTSQGHREQSAPRPNSKMLRGLEGERPLRDFFYEDMVAAQVTIPTEEGRLDLTVYSAYFAGDIGAENPPTLVKNLVRHCRRNNMQLDANLLGKYRPK